MGKSIVITVMVDNVEFSEIEEIETAIQQAVEEYKDKRVITNIQDEPLIRPHPR